MFALIIKQNNQIIDKRVIENMDNSLKLPLFPNEEYEFTIYDEMVELIYKSTIKTINKEVTFDIKAKVSEKKEISINEIVDKINELISKRHDAELKLRLNLIKFMDPDWTYNDDLIRGGRLEQLISDLLSQLKSKGVITNFIWSGSVKEYGLAYPVKAKPDFLVYLDDFCIVLEVTVIHGIRRQWEAEGASVPDHVRDTKLKESDKRVFGIFSAPTIHEPLRKNLEAQSRIENTPIVSIPINELLSLLLAKDKGTLKSNINSLMSYKK